jgi:hypothetical protein
MVWVPEGNFWLSRSKVTKKKFHSVMADGMDGEN